jgi:hypothetical protein
VLDVIVSGASSWPDGSAPVRWECIPFHAPILYDDKPLSRQTNGHLITFDWNNGRTGFLSQVSLFNTITYRIAICPEFEGLWSDDYYRGHHFNTEDRTIAPLTRVSKPLLQLRSADCNHTKEWGTENHGEQRDGCWQSLSDNQL